MIGYFDLHDIHAVFICIRSCPEHPANEVVINRILSDLREKDDSWEPNRIRKIIQSCGACQDKDGVYGFALTENAYSYVPMTVLKDDRIYDVLIASFEEMQRALNEGNIVKIYDLADCLHNLPILLTDNKYRIPKTFWENEVRYYRSKWNGLFLKDEQKTCLKMK